MKKKILVVQPDFGPSGGGNVVAACLIEALKCDCAVSVLSWAPPDIDAVNRVFATSLRSSEFTSHSAPMFLRVLAKVNPWLYSLRYGILLRLCKKMRRNYDIIMSVNNEADFGCKGIQYVHDPPYWYYNSYDNFRSAIWPLFRYNLWAVFKGKHRPWMVVAGFSFDRMKRNVTLVNSNWTGSKVREVYGIASTIVYPPVLDPLPNVPWESRETGFVCIGRVITSKNLEKILEIMENVRLKAPETHLHIIGTSDQRGYLDTLLHSVRDSSWIFINENVSREELRRLIASHRYGIHGMNNEPFGLAVAEMIQGGCIVFVPRNAGPMEILGGDERLMYETAEEAVRKIIRVMRNPDEQASILRYLDSRRGLFSREHFTKRIQQIIEQFPECIEPYSPEDGNHHSIVSNQRVLGHEA